MGPIKAITSGLKNSFAFSGRASLPEFWWLIAALTLIEVILFAIFASSGGLQLGMVTVDGSEISLVFAATCLVLGFLFISITWRRLQDIGWVGWAVLIWLAVGAFFVRILMLVAQDLVLCRTAETKKCFAEVSWGYGFTPAVLTLVLVIGFGLAMARPSESGPNKYGPNPHEAA